MAITKKYLKYLLHDPKWKAKRLKVLWRDGYICQQCKWRRATQVHHLTYTNIFNEPLSDLQSVCKKCHQKIHGIKRKWHIKSRLGYLVFALAWVWGLFYAIGL